MGNLNFEHFPAFRNRSALTVASSVLALLLGISVNLINEFRWPDPALLTSAVLGILLLTTLALRARIEVQAKTLPDLEAAEASALKRIQALLTGTGPPTGTLIDLDDLQVSVVARGDHTISEPHKQISSAFIAKLTTDPRCTIITGFPGSGKSTLLLTLATRMVEARARGKVNLMPLLLRGAQWHEDADFVTWVGNQAAHIYGIPQSLTRYWMHRGAALLILDDLDEIPRDYSPSFVRALNRWLNSAVGGRAVLACRQDAYLETFRGVLHDQVANLEPLSHISMREILSRLASSEFPGWATTPNIRPLLELIQEMDDEDSRWSTPLVVRMLVEAVRDSSIASGDPLTSTLKLGDRLSRRGDREAALESYLTVAESSTSVLRSLAGMRASMLLAEAGSSDRAREVLARSLASEIERPLYDPLRPAEEHLSDDERVVLASLSRDNTFDAFQISSRSSIAPSRCNEALRKLRDRGLIDVLDGDGEPRFRRSTVELIEA